MREIKFRAWNKDEKKMYRLEEWANEIDTAWFSIYESGDWWLTFNNCEDDDRVLVYHKNGILMQFTGLYDKNGKEIYEGDIVEIKDFCFDPSSSLCPVRTVRNVVEWSDGDGAFITCDVLLSRYIRDIEIIGNIYENPELVDGKGE